ncbi:MAG: hypothetical protein LBO09_07115 [Candidatus Peribacteria bacterium]|jgi:peptidoglycan/LPS O-acetylase OafA/YrhL|nr:hypothetical protein [Candidatus Peribacteria bacterium]
MLHFLKLDHIKTTIARFPVAVLLTLVLSVLFFCLVHSSSSRETQLMHGVFATVLTFFLSIGVGLKWEELAMKKGSTLIFQAITLVFGILFSLRFAWSGEEQSVQLFVLLLTCVLSICFIAPFVVERKKEEKADLNIPYSQYFLKFATVILFGFIL